MYFSQTREEKNWCSYGGFVTDEKLCVQQDKGARILVFNCLLCSKRAKNIASQKFINTTTTTTATGASITATFTQEILQNLTSVSLELSVSSTLLPSPHFISKKGYKKQKYYSTLILPPFPQIDLSLNLFK